MVDKRSGSSSRCIQGKDDDILFQEFSHLLETIKDSHSSSHGVSVNLVMRSVVVIDEFNRRTMELPHDDDSRRFIREDRFFSSLREDFLELSLEADNFFQALVTNLKKLQEDLGDLLEALLQWNPSLGREDKREIIVLDKLWNFGWGKGFSEELLKLFQGLLKQHHGIMEKVQTQGDSLKRKVKRMKRLKKAISTIFVGFLTFASFCSVIVAALQPGAAFATITAVLTSAASWPHLSLWVNGLWKDKLKELHQRKELCTMHQGKELSIMLPSAKVINRDHVLRDFEPMYSFAHQLKEMLQKEHSSAELLLMQESLQNELCQVIKSISGSIEKVESSKDNIEGRRNMYLK